MRGTRAGREQAQWELPPRGSSSLAADGPGVDTRRLREVRAKEMARLHREQLRAAKEGLLGAETHGGAASRGGSGA